MQDVDMFQDQHRMQGLREVFNEKSKEELVELVLELSEAMGKLRFKPDIPHIIAKLGDEFTTGLERKYEENEYADRTYKIYFRKLISVRYPLTSNKQYSFLPGDTLEDTWLGLDISKCRYKDMIIVTANKNKQALFQVKPLVELMLEWKKPRF